MNRKKTENPKKSLDNPGKELGTFQELSSEISLLLKDESLKYMLEGLTACAFSINSQKLFDEKADTARLNKDFLRRMSEFRNSVTSRKAGLLSDISDITLYEKVLQPLYRENLSY